MPYVQTIGSTRYVFDDLKTLLARASPERSGDKLAGCAARSVEERVASRMALADVPTQFPGLLDANAGVVKAIVEC